MFAAPNSSSIMGSVPAQPARRGLGHALDLPELRHRAVDRRVLLAHDRRAGQPPPGDAGQRPAPARRAARRRAPDRRPAAGVVAVRRGPRREPDAAPAGRPAAPWPRLPAAARQTLTGREFFPGLISGPFQHGLVIVFALAAVLSVLAALASALRGARPAPAPATPASPAPAPADSVQPLHAPADTPTLLTRPARTTRRAHHGIPRAPPTDRSMRLSPDTRRDRVPASVRRCSRPSRIERRARCDPWHRSAARAVFMIARSDTARALAHTRQSFRRPPIRHRRRAIGDRDQRHRRDRLTASLSRGTARHAASTGPSPPFDVPGHR